MAYDRKRLGPAIAASEATSGPTFMSHALGTSRRSATSATAELPFERVRDLESGLSRISAVVADLGPARCSRDPLRLHRARRAPCVVTGLEHDCELFRRDILPTLGRVKLAEIGRGGWLLEGLRVPTSGVEGARRMCRRGGRWLGWRA